MINNKWSVALGAVLTQISIGSVYAYSVMINPVSKILGATASDLKISFSIAISILGVFSAVMTPFLSKKNPQIVIFCAAILYSSGIAMTGYAVSSGSLALLYLGYGVLGGLGLGFGYAAPIYTLVKWFPENKGFATGLGVMGFGFAALVFGPMMANMFISHYIGDVAEYTARSISFAFYKLSMVYLVLISIGALLTIKPKQTEASVKSISEASAKEDILSAPYLTFCLLFLLNTICGITLISTAAPMMQSLFQLTSLQAAGIVGVMGLFNGLGRFVWSFVSDYIGRVGVLALFGALQLVSYITMSITENVIVFQACLFLVISFYGAGFSLAPAFISDTFGDRKMTTLYGLILICWSIAAVAGPIGVSYLQENVLGGDYLLILMGFAVVFVVFLALVGALKVSLTARK